MKPSTFLLCLGTALLAAGSGRAADQPCGNNQTQSPSAPPSRNHPCNGDGANLFNAYTGNASREVVDLTVFGSVGELPLKMVRYSNTRLSSMAQSTGRFGKEGVWTHGYQWSMRDGGLYTNGQPVLRIGFPDGSDMAYIQDVSDPTLWLPHANGTSRVTQSGTAFTLLRADGTLYRFNKYPYTTSGYYYRLDSCEDALGNVYAMQYNSVTDTSLRKVVDPSGRWLQFTYVNHGLLNQEKTVLHTTPYPGTAGSWVEATGISTTKAHRYLTLYYNNDWHNAPPLPVAEVEFYDENNNLITGGTPFGSEPVLAAGEESGKAFDGNAATYYRYAYKRNGYVGIDLGVGVTKKVSRIRYLLANVGGSTPTASAQFVGMNSLAATHYSIKEVKASDGRKVVYNYSTFTDASGGFSWSLLDSATYPDATQALYGYTQVHPYTRPILSHAVDPRVPGAGSVITYGFDPDTSLGFVREERNGITNEVIATTSHDAAHQPKAVYSNGRTIKYSYTGSTANLTQKIDGMGGVSNFVYGNGGAGHLVSETDARGHTTTYTRTALGNPLVTTYPDGTVETITRDARERILTFTVTGPGLAARVTTNTRDGAGRITRKDHPDGTYETWTYNGLGQVLTHTERDGGVETTTYTVNGVPQTYADGAGDVRTYVYNSLDQLTSVTNVNSHTTSYVQNDRGQTTQVTHPDASFISYTYDDHGNRIQMVNELGKVWTCGYDEYNRLTSVVDPLSQLTHYSYVGAGGCGTCNTGDLATLVTLPSGRQIHSTYDLDWQLTSRTTGYGTADAATTSYVYDGVGNVTQVTDANGKVSLYTYDNRNRCVTSKDALNRQTTLVYDGEGNVLSVTQPDGGVTTAVYDTMDRQTSVTDPKSQTTAYTYDAAGRLKTMTDARGKVHTWSYDLAGRPTELLYPDATTEQWTYDGVGNRLTTKTRQGQVATATFDNRNREVTYDWSDSTPDVVRTYDVGGMLATSGNTHATSSYTYDDAGRKLTESQYVAALAQSYTVTYGYDADGNCTSVTYPGGSVVDYSYTARGQVKEIQADGPPPLASYTYHANGERATRSLENGTVTTYAIDDASQTTSVVQSNGGGVFQRYDYTYDAAGRRKTQLVNNATWDVYTFDAAGQVSGVTYEAVNSSGSGGTRQVTYVHDAAGNRQSVTVAGSGSTLLPPLATGTTTYGAAIATNQYPTVGGQTLLYDGRGNLVQVPVDLNVPAAGNRTLGYDAQNRVLGVSSPGNAVTFAYDTRNRQVSRTVNGVTTFFIWDGWDLIEERDAAGVLVQRYVHGARKDELLSKTDSAGTVYYHQDVLGSVTALTDALGQPKETYRYDIYGAVGIWDVASGVPLATSALGNRFLYTGREWIAEAGLYDYRNRAYLPELGRFLQTDPILFLAGDMNLYRYVENDPVDWLDPYGTAPSSGDERPPTCIPGLVPPPPERNPRPANPVPEKPKHDPEDPNRGNPFPKTPPPGPKGTPFKKIEPVPGSIPKSLIDPKPDTDPSKEKNPPTKPPTEKPKEEKKDPKETPKEPAKEKETPKKKGC